MGRLAIRRNHVLRWGIQQRAKGSSISTTCPSIPSLRLRAPVSVVEEGDVVATDVHGMVTTSSEPVGPFGTWARCVFKGGSTDRTNLTLTAASQRCPRVEARPRRAPGDAPTLPRPPGRPYSLPSEKHKDQGRVIPIFGGGPLELGTRRGQDVAPVALISAVARGRDLEWSADSTLDPRVGRARPLAPPRA